MTILRQSALLVTIARSARGAVASYRSERQKKAWIAARSARIHSYLDAHRVHKLHLGAGPAVLSGWLNTDLTGTPDVIYVDVTKPFPFGAGTFDYVFSEHLIEHVLYRDGLFMLHECLRVLKPGGTIRIATPDLEFLARLCLSEKTDLEHRYIKLTIDTVLPDVGRYNECFVVNHFIRNYGHRFVYNARTLEEALKEAGFTDIVRHSVGDSDDGNLRGIESHGKIIGEEMNLLETMVFEARRPGAPSDRRP